MKLTKKLSLALALVLSMVMMASVSAFALTANLTVGLTEPAATVTGGVTLPVDLNKSVKAPTTKGMKKNDLRKPFVGVWKMNAAYDISGIALGMDTDLMVSVFNPDGTGAAYLAGNKANEFTYKVTKDYYYGTDADGTEKTTYKFSKDGNKLCLYGEDGDLEIAYERIA